MCHTVPLIRTDLLGRQQYMKAFQDRSPNDLGRVGNQLKIYSFQLTYNHSVRLVRLYEGLVKLYWTVRRMETQHSSMHISFMKENIKTKKFSNNLDSHHSADTVALVTVVHLKVLKGDGKMFWECRKDSLAQVSSALFCYHQQLVLQLTENC